MVLEPSTSAFLLGSFAYSFVVGWLLRLLAPRKVDPHWLLCAAGATAALTPLIVSTPLVALVGLMLGFASCLIVDFAIQAERRLAQ